MSSNVIYESTISEQLKPFISSLKNLITNYEEIIVGISKSLPRIETEIDDNVLEARELLSFISSQDNSGESYGVKHEMDQFHIKLNIALKALEKAEKEDRITFSKLRESIELSTKTLGKTKDIQNISENLKVFAINSIVYSQKAGLKGKGYQVISGEFIILSETIATGTEKINKIGSVMHTQIDEFHGMIKEHEEFSRNHIESISKDSGVLLNKANKSVESFSIILNDLLNRIEAVKEPTSQIMAQLQKQDIIQQQLEHLMEAIRDILLIIENPENYREERNTYTLLGILMVTVETQINRIGEELVEMINGMEILFDNMNASIMDINSDKSHFSQLVNIECETEDCPSIVDIIFKTPCDMIKSIEEDLQKSVIQKQFITECFSGIEEKIKEEKDLALQFVPIIESINNLHILAKIEQARYELKISSQDKNSNFGFFSEEAYSELAEIVKEIENAHLTVSHNLNESKNSFATQVQDYANMGTQLDSSLAIIEKTREMFIDNFNLVINITNELFNHVKHHIQLFQTLRGLVNDITDKMYICNDINKIVNEKLNTMGGPVQLADCIFKDAIIQNIVEKCTVEEERTTLSSKFEEFDIEESAGSNITLF
ncbi:MAG: hypothetical protein JEY99_08490 [Spirochaetales bacterium]|nr:hypothetical protein [Spirochaetales bacterium]